MSEEGMAGAGAGAGVAEIVDATVRMAAAGRTDEASKTLHAALHDHFFGAGRILKGKEEFAIDMARIVNSIYPEGTPTNTNVREEMDSFYKSYQSACFYTDQKNKSAQKTSESKYKMVQAFENFWNKLDSLFSGMAAYVMDKMAQRKMNHIADLIDGKTWGQRSAKMVEKAMELGGKVGQKAVAAGRALAGAGARVAQAAGKHLPSIRKSGKKSPDL